MARPGAHRPELIVDADLTWLAGLPDVVRIVTLAPERAGAIDAIRLLAARGVVVALGHSTASAEQSRAALDAGARLVTHLFNGMAPFHHRDPGLCGVALTDGRVVASLIADLVHVDAVGLELAFAAKGGDGLALVTDAVPGPQRGPDGTLRGGHASMAELIANVARLGIPLATAVQAAASTPARLLGLDDRGAIEFGRRADLVVLGPELEVEAVYIAGGLALGSPG